jgi:hypothetical protein
VRRPHDPEIVAGNNPDDRFERFGLPRPPSDSNMETASQRIFRQAQVAFEGGLVLGDLFAALKSHLGVDATQRLFRACCKPRQRQYRGVSNPENDARLLEIYDLWVENENNTKSAPRLIAERLHQSERRKYGATATAIEKHIRRLVSERAEEEADRAELQESMKNEAQKWAAAQAERERKMRKTPATERLLKMKKKTTDK